MAKKRSKSLNGSLDPKLTQTVTPEERQRMIAEAAYYHALHRGFSGGSAEDDWLQAEQEVNHALLQQPSTRSRRSASTRATRSPASADRETV